MTSDGRTSDGSTPDSRTPGGNGTPPTDPDTTYRSAGGYAVAVIVVALAFIGAAALLYDTVPTALIVVFPLIILAGAIGALRRTYTVYRAGGRWQIWQGASWVLLALFMVALTGTGGSLLGR